MKHEIRSKGISKIPINVVNVKAYLISSYKSLMVTYYSQQATTPLASCIKHCAHFDTFNIMSNTLTNLFQSFLNFQSTINKHYQNLAPNCPRQSLQPIH